MPTSSASERVLQRCRPGRRLARFLNHPPDRGQWNRRFGSAARLVLEAGKPLSVEALRPLAHARGAHAQARRHLLLPNALAPQKHDVRPEAVTRRRRRGCNPTFQLSFLLGSQPPVPRSDVPSHPSHQKRVAQGAHYVKAFIGQDTRWCRLTGEYPVSSYHARSNASVSVRGPASSSSAARFSAAESCEADYLQRTDGDIVRCGVGCGVDALGDPPRERAFRVDINRQDDRPLGVGVVDVGEALRVRDVGCVPQHPDGQLFARTRPRCRSGRWASCREGLIPERQGKGCGRPALLGLECRGGVFVPVTRFAFFSVSAISVSAINRSVSSTVAG